MTPPPSRFGPLHALAAGAVLVLLPLLNSFAAVWKQFPGSIRSWTYVRSALLNGFSVFWHQFLHGSVMPTDEKSIMMILAQTALLFGGLFLILWVSTLFQGRNKRDRDNEHLSRCDDWDKGRLARCIRLTLLSAVPICLVALGLNWVNGELLSHITNVELADQDFVRLLTTQSFSTYGKVILFSFLLLEAPIIEELLFRGVVFGGCAKIMPVWGAMFLSGFIFAFIHVNAATFVPLWFLGIAFAWLYARTGTLLAPMAVHFTFNAVNLILCLFF